jgi:hypothetical protein
VLYAYNYYRLWLIIETLFHATAGGETKCTLVRHKLDRLIFTTVALKERYFIPDVIM